VPLIPIILELDEELADNETFVGIRTITIKEGNVRRHGYVGIIKIFSVFNDIRYCNLKATKYDKGKFGNTVI